jgi:hypothetical protein
VTLDVAEMKKVKKVAIIGFRGRIPEKGDILARTIKAISDQSFGPKLYNVAQAQLSKSMGWNVLALKKVVAAPSIKSYGKEKLNKVITAISYKDHYILIPGILEPSTAAGVLGDPKRRAALSRELGVDALMTMEFKVESSVAGDLGSGMISRLTNQDNIKVTLLECDLMLELKQVPNGKKIWYQPGIQAKGADNPSASFFNIPFPNLKQRAVVSSFSNALAAHIRDAKNP